MNRPAPQEIARALLWELETYTSAIDYAARIERSRGELAGDYAQARAILEREQERARVMNRAANFAPADGCSSD